MTALRAGPLARHVPPADSGASGSFDRLVARQLVTEEVLALEAEAAGIVGSPTAGATARPDGLSRVVASLVERVTASLTVPESDVRAYYDRNRDRYRIRETRRVRHVLLADAATARWVVDRIRGGVGFEPLAQRYSIDSGSRDLGGDLGEVRRGVLPRALEEAISNAAVGAVVGPIETEHGWHVARVESVTRSGHARYEDVRGSIEAELLAGERERVFGEWLEERRAALAVIATEFAHPGDPVNGVPSHRH
jgi:PPIC-type PPIASE domain